MKKLICSLGILVGASMSLRAEQFETPSGPMQALASSDYGGYYSTISVFSSQISTIVAVGADGTQGVFAGVVFSSGNCGAYDFVDVFDSTSSPVNDGQRNASYMCRVYNVSGATQTASNNVQACSGWNGPKYPQRFKKGLRAQPSTNAYNVISILFYVKPD